MCSSKRLNKRIYIYIYIYMIYIYDIFDEYGQVYYVTVRCNCIFNACAHNERKTVRKLKHAAAYKSYSSSTGAGTNTTGENGPTPASL